jgi:uncharacterized protein
MSTNVAVAHRLKFRHIGGKHAVCSVPVELPIPGWALGGQLLSVTRTPEELSIVCPEEQVPPQVKAATGWICFKIEGPFPFTQTGILTSFIGPLSGHTIPVFAISTFDTDYVLVPEKFRDPALAALTAAGHELIAD